MKTNKLFTMFVVLSNVINLTSQTITYVNINATGSNNGTSWANAYKSLYTAINSNVQNRQIWVAQGTYTPFVGDGFHLKNTIQIYGGFDGTETNLSQRNWTLNVTTLQANGSRVVIAYGNNNYPINSTAILDGFTITGGRTGAGGSTSYPGGAGIHNYYASPTLENLVITDNTDNTTNGGGIYFFESTSLVKNVRITKNTAYSGGGVYCENYTPGTAPRFIQVVIDSNNAANSGGGIFNKQSSIYVENSKIRGNYAQMDGGGIYSTGYSNLSDPSQYPIYFINSLFSGNSTFVNGGSAMMYSGSNTTILLNVTVTNNECGRSTPGGINSSSTHLYISNSIIYGNTTLMSGDNRDRNLVFDSYNNYAHLNNCITTNTSLCSTCINIDPKFIDFGGNNYNLLNSSPAVNAGSNSSYTCTTNTDLNGNSRIFNGTIDIGAFENPGYAVVNIKETENNSLSLRLYPNPVQNKLFISSPEIISYAELRIYDVANCEVLKTVKRNFTVESIDLQWLNNGIYFLKLMSSTQERSFKFIVNH